MTLTFTSRESSMWQSPTKQDSTRFGDVVVALRWRTSARVWWSLDMIGFVSIAKEEETDTRWCNGENIS